MNKPIPYDKARAIAHGGDTAARRDLARRADTQAEILYYLADDSSADVRREIARNAATPGQANLRLAEDDDGEVRCELARKVARLLPELSAAEATRLRDLALAALELLAKDQLPRVRAILAEELKHSTYAPRALALTLAHDLESVVALPILEFSPLLSDHDLLEIIAKGAVDDRLRAIARRENVSAKVSDAVVATLEVPALAALLANAGAKIREDAMDRIVACAEGAAALHEPLVMRADLSVRAIRRIAGFVAASLVDMLCRQRNVDQATEAAIRRQVQDRLKDAPLEPDADDPALRAKALHAKGQLDEACIADAIEGNERAFVIAALVIRTGQAAETVTRLLASRSAKAIVALAWKAGLGMRAAVRLQARIGLVPPREMLNARRGVDYPLSERELSDTWDLLAG
jgi:uncharacterized protein (DUF2336 family)